MKNPLSTWLVLVLLSLPVVAFAQADKTVDGLLDTIRDESKSWAVRGPAISCILACGDGRGHDELAKLLASPETSNDLRLHIASGSLFAAGLPLIDGVIDLAVVDDELGAKVRGLFGDVPDGELVEALSQRIDGEKTIPERRLALVGLLGYTGRRSALDRLADLWDSEDSAVSDEAAKAFRRILPKEFSGAAAARKFLTANPKLDVAELIKQHAPENGASKPDPAVPYLIDLARKNAETADFKVLLEDYLAFEKLAEIRKIGAEALTEYAWEEREAAGAEEAQAVAAGVVLDVLDMEPDDEVTVVLLGTVQSLTKAALAVQPERTNHVVTKRLASPNRAVRLVAVETLGKLGDKRAIVALQTQYDKAGEADAEYRLAVLSSLEIIRNAQAMSNGGMSTWVLAKLKSEKLETVVARLLEILGGTELKDAKELEDAVGTLAALLRGSENGKIRRLAAGRLGLLGARPGVPEALDALAEAGLADEDPNVREVSATSLGRAPRDKVRPGILDSLAKRLGDAETESKVRTAAAGSLLRLQGVAALPKLMPLVSDEDVWQQAVLTWLASDILAVPSADSATDPTSSAATLVRALREAGAFAQCAEAAGRILDADALVWEGPAVAHRRAIVLDRAWSAAETGKPSDALALITDADLPESVTDADSFDLLYLHARLRCATGHSGEALSTLETLLAAAPLIEGAKVELVRLALGECHLSGEDWDAAVAAVAPLLELPDYAERARAIEERAKLGEKTKKLIADLDATEEAVRLAAVDGLKGMGEAAYSLLDRWLTSREGNPATAAAAVATIAKILAKPLTYDPKATDEARKKALAAVHAALKPGA